MNTREKWKFPTTTQPSTTVDCPSLSDEHVRFTELEKLLQFLTSQILRPHCSQMLPVMTYQKDYQDWAFFWINDFFYMIVP